MAKVDDEEFLLEEYKILQKQLESTKQELDEAKASLEVFKKSEAHYLEEIELLKKEGDESQQKLIEKGKALRNTIVTLTEEHNKAKNELLEKIKANTERNAEVGEQITPVDISTVSELSCDNDYNNISNIQQRNAEFEAKIYHLKQILETCKKDHEADLEEQAKKDAEILKCRREERQEAKTRQIKLDDELVAARTALENVKRQLHDFKATGNSMFAELDDKCTEVQKQMKTLRKMSNEMKVQNSYLLEKIQRLELAHSKLLKELDNELDKEEEEMEELLSRSMGEAANLTGVLESCQSELDEILKNPVPERVQLGWKQLEYLLKMKDKEIIQCRQMLQSDASKITNLAHEFRDVTKTLLKTHSESLKLEVEIFKLEAEIACLQISESNAQPQPM